MDLTIIQNVLFYKGIGSIAAYISCLALSIMVFTKNSKNKLNIIFSIVCFIASIWNAIIYFIIETTSTSDAILAWKLYFITTITLLAILTYFCAELSNRKIPLANMLLTVLVVTPLILFTSFFISGINEVNGILFHTKGPVFFIVDLYQLTMVIACLNFLKIGHENAEDSMKQKIKLVSLGLGIALIAGGIDITLRIVGIDLLPISSLMTIVTLIFISKSFKVGDLK